MDEKIGVVGVALVEGQLKVFRLEMATKDAGGVTSWITSNLTFADLVGPVAELSRSAINRATEGLSTNSRTPRVPRQRRKTRVR